MGHIIADVAFILVGVLIIILCAKRGLIKSLMKLARLLLAAGAAYLFGGKLAQFISEKFLSTPIRNAVFEKINKLYLEAAESFSTDKILSSFPDFLMNDQMKEQIGSMEGSGEELVNSATDSIAAPLTRLTSNIIGYVVVFIVALILLSIVIWLVGKIIDKLTLLRVVDRALGAVLGVVFAAIILFIAASVMKSFLSDNPIYAESVFVKFLGESTILDVMKFLDVGKTWFQQLFA